MTTFVIRSGFIEHDANPVRCDSVIQIWQATLDTKCYIFLKNCLNGVKGCEGIFNKIFKEISKIKVQIYNKDTCLTFAFCKLII